MPFDSGGMGGAPPAEPDLAGPREPAPIPGSSPISAFASDLTAENPQELDEPQMAGVMSYVYKKTAID